MKVTRTTLILLLILAAGIAFTWFWEFSPEKDSRQTPTPTSMPKVLGSWSSDDIVTLEIAFSADVQVRLRKNPDSTWAYVSLEGKQPDQGKVFQLLDSLTNLYATNTISSGISLKEIGLDNPTISIKIQNKEKDLKTIKVGGITPIQNGYYIQVNEETPIVSSKYSIDSITELVQDDYLTLITTTPME